MFSQGKRFRWEKCAHTINYINIKLKNMNKLRIQKTGVIETLFPENHAVHLRDAKRVYRCPVLSTDNYEFTKN